MVLYMALALIGFYTLAVLCIRLTHVTKSNMHVSCVYDTQVNKSSLSYR